MTRETSPTSRDQQRQETRARIVEAAIEVFAERGFHGASTRAIAGRCGVTQGLLTYHFQSKANLWREAADHLFSNMLRATRASVAALRPQGPRHFARAVVRAYVLYVADRPAIVRFMTQEGQADDARMRWLVDTHLRVMYQSFVGVMTMAGVAEDTVDASHLYYVMAGAGSLMFSVRSECVSLTGIEPTDPAVIERHADLVARLLVPDPL